MNVDSVRICPAEDATRRQQIVDRKGTSYLLNDLVFDDVEYPGGGRASNQLNTITFPGRTLAAMISARPVSATWDHAHCGNWNSWSAVLADVAVDRHGRKSGRPLRASEPVDFYGSANYLYLDGRVENITAQDWKAYVDRGVNPGAVLR